MAIVEFERPFDWDPNVTKAVIKGEQHTIPTSPPYDIYLHHIPREESPSTVVIPGFTAVASSPGPGEFRVHYTEVGGYPRGRITFNAVNAGQTVSVDYHACGTVIWAEDRGDGRPNIAEMQEVLERVQEASGIDYASAVSEFTPQNVKAALDALAGVRIVEMGSNSNGEYVRWENGLQVCLAHSGEVTREVTTSLNNWYRSPSDLSWTYPAAFIQIPAAGVFIARWGAVYAWALNRVVGETSLKYMIISNNSAAQDVRESFIAIGRWK